MLTTIRSGIAESLLKVFASDHPARTWFSNPEMILDGAGVRAGERVLEVGCGRGFFTLPLAKRLGDTGSLVALDVTHAAADYVGNKVKLAGRYARGMDGGAGLVAGLDRSPRALRACRQVESRSQLLQAVRAHEFTSDLHHP